MKAEKYIDNENINKIIEHKGKFELRGGAGSGKTTVLLSLIDYHLKENRKILAISFTNAAKNEIIERFGKDENLEVRTIHSFFRSFLRSVDKRVLSFLEKNIDLYKNTFIKEEEEKGEIFKIKGFGFQGDVSWTEQINTGILYISHTATLRIAADILQADEELLGLLDSYYEMIFIDEYQDTDKNVIDLFSSEKIKNTSIGFFGDSKQMIYKREEYDFVDFKNINVFFKEDNFRSSKKIVNFINKFREDFQQKAMNEEIKDFDSVLKVYEDMPNRTETIKFIEKEENIKFDKILHLKNDQRLSHVYPGAFDDIYAFNKKSGGTTKADFSKASTPHVLFICKILQYIDEEQEINNNFWVISEDEATGEKVMVKGDVRENISSSLEEFSEEMKKMNSLKSARELAQKLFDNRKLREELNFFINERTIEDINNPLFNNLEWKLYEEVYKLFSGKYINSTIHSVKGQEFDSVAIFLDHENWNNYNFQKYFDKTSNKFENKERLLYVGFSRSKKNLVIITPNKSYTEEIEVIINE